MSDESASFYLGDKLPTKFEVVMALLNGAKQIRMQANKPKLTVLSKAIEALYNR